MNARAGLDVLEKIRGSFTYWDSNPGSLNP